MGTLIKNGDIKNLVTFVGHFLSVAQMDEFKNLAQNWSVPGGIRNWSRYSPQQWKVGRQMAVVPVSHVQKMAPNKHMDLEST